MIASRFTMLAASAGVVTLAACTPAPYDPAQPNTNARRGALTGGLIGAAAGMIDGDSGGDRVRSAAIGAAVGAAAGGLVGNALDRQAAELRDQFSNSAIDVIRSGDQLVVRMPEGILFATDSAAVRASLQSDLGVLARSLNKYPRSTVNVVGHTDNTGSSAYNQDLSQRRASAVSSILIGSGVSSSRVRSIGRGESQPIASNLTTEGRSQNRRVEIVITGA